MKEKGKVIVVGLGEIGTPLLKLASEYYEVVGVDIAPVGPVENADVMYVCYPFEIKDFIGVTAAYIDQFKPALTIIHSTVAPGTTRKIAERANAAVVNSPVRGKHARMLEELKSYKKFVGALDPKAGQMAADHFESMGLKTTILSSPEATELAKLTETTYFGVLIAWAQEVERYCEQMGVNYDDVVAFYEDIKFFPVKYFSGPIGGHCVMPNIEILKTCVDTLLPDAVRISNTMKNEREAQKAAPLAMSCQ